MADGTTRGKRRLARFIKQLQGKSGLTAEEIARRTRVSRPTVTRLLQGTHLARWPSVSVILDELAAPPELKTFLLRMWEVADVDNARIEHAGALPVKYRRFRMDELEAYRERTLDVAYVPGMLQTAGYAEAVARASHRLVVGDDWVETAGAERLSRQQLLSRADPFELHALIDEAALRRAVGGPAVLREQLDHLVDAAERPNVTIQVLPFDAGAYGPQPTALLLLDFPEEDAPCAAYTEEISGLAMLEEPEEVEPLDGVWRDAAAAALTPEDSVKFVLAVRDTLGDS
ncbi:transcriptional regulator with XRE-family HTH domain [Saccharothrix tamanrassetensis]|uniref:Transcriptional regulator with XRE-family HTH domain n=1 Tax=Saccharothrix tamanrassetensis TaxID=1051531 RepID=A0A841CQ17_9PSEU|nr:helix-turn-helix transcriptional regulator [Saccharothrix tamanrassetensis]MBB5959003.1 transcriptional regulator with XRE-family HTH domain [Saccharothrix tamanrassetensis]